MAPLVLLLGLASCATVPLDTPLPQDGPGFVTLEINPQPIIIDPDLRDLPGFTSPVLPRYPQQAIDDRVDGDVVVHALIDASGWLRELQLVKSIMELDESVLTAVRACAFRPARNVSGEPMEAWVSITAHFELRN